MRTYYRVPKGNELVTPMRLSYLEYEFDCVLDKTASEILVQPCNKKTERELMQLSNDDKRSIIEIIGIKYCDRYKQEHDK